MQSQHIDHYVRNFYEEQLRLLRETTPKVVREHYLKTCATLPEQIPVTIRMHEETSVALSNLDRVIVVANHIPTVELFSIRDDDFVRSFVENPKVLYRESIRPVILRHFPFVNLLKQHMLNTHVFTFDPPEPFRSMIDAWGHLHIGHDQPNKLNWLANKVQKLEEPWAVVIYPEGEDSKGDLLNHEYELHPFRKGFSVLSSQLAVPILPISMTFNPQTVSYSLLVHDLIYPPTTEEVLNHVNIVQQQVEHGIQLLLKDLT